MGATSGDLPEGARRLKAYLERKGIKARPFALAHGLDENHLQKILRGERRRISVDVMIRIEGATGGAVPVKSWQLGAGAAAPARRVVVTQGKTVRRAAPVKKAGGSR